MRDLQKVFQNCIVMMDEIGIDYGKIIKVTVNTRAKRRWGQCHIERRGYAIPTTYSINISEVLLDERVPLEALQNTMIHEILHTCPGCFNHGNGWQLRAEKVKRELGYNIKRIDSREDKGVSNSVAADYVVPKYILRCKKCGVETGKFRMCQVVKHPDNWRCSICHGDLERIK